MKRYIILTPSVGSMGGSEMYTNNKVQYLKSQGWAVDVFFYVQHDILLPALKAYEYNFVPELRRRIYFFTRKQRERIIDRICENVKQDDEVYVESHLFHMVFWGELVAKKTGGVSISCCMEEHIPAMNDKVAAFFDYKVRRWEVLNAYEKSLHRYFGEKYKNEYVKYTHNYLNPLCSNVVSLDDYDLSKIPTADYNVLSIGRLDKPYILPMVNEVCQFAANHSDTSLNLILIGGSQHGNVENIINNEVKDIQNLKVILLGFMFPIPEKLIKYADVAIGCSNSILVTAEQGVPTIAIEFRDYKPLGIYGITTMNIKERDKEPFQDINSLLTEILIEKKYENSPIKIEKQPSVSEVFSKQVDFLSLSPHDNSYYDVESIYSIKEYLLSRGNWLRKKITNV